MCFLIYIHNIFIQFFIFSYVLVSIPKLFYDLFKDTQLSSLAIGRFIGELVADLDISVGYNTTDSNGKSEELDNNKTSKFRINRGLTSENAPPPPALSPLEKGSKISEPTTRHTPNGRPPPIAPLSTPPTFTGTLLERINYFFAFLYPLNPNPTIKLGQTNIDNDRDTQNKTEIGKSQKFKLGNYGVRSSTKFLIYSGHDSTMVPLLGAIGLYQGIHVFININVHVYINM